MAEYYGTIDGVLIRTGIKPDDLGFVGEEDSDSSGDIDDAFGDFIVELLREATDLMDRVMGKTWLPDPPRGLTGIANDAVSDALRTMVQGRQTPVVRIDDFAVRTIETVVLSRDIEKRLKLYSSGGGMRSIEIGDPYIQGVPSDITAAQLNDMDASA